MYSKEQVEKLKEIFPIGEKTRIISKMTNDQSMAHMWENEMFYLLGSDLEIEQHHTHEIDGTHTFSLFLLDPNTGDLFDFYLNWIDDERISEYQKIEKATLNRHFDMRSELVQTFRMNDVVRLTTDDVGLKKLIDRCDSDDEDHESDECDIPAELYDDNWKVIGYSWPEGPVSTTDFALEIYNEEADFMTTVHIDMIDSPRVKKFKDKCKLSNVESTEESSGFAGMALAGLATGLIAVLAANSNNKEAAKELDKVKVEVRNEV